MPFYIANGREVRGECSVKVFAESDAEAFDRAKEQLPIVSSLERIEVDGSVVPVQDLPFDSLKQEILPVSEIRHEQGRKAGDEQRAMRTVIWGIGILIALNALAFTCSHVYREAQLERQAATRSQPGAGQK